MKNKGRKTLSLKAQAVSQIISSLVMISLFIGIILEKVFNTRALHDAINKYEPLILVVIAVVIVFMFRYQNQPDDELSRALMLKANKFAVKIELIAATSCGLIMHLNGNRKDIEYYKVMGSDVVMFGIFLCGVYFAARSAAFLWLDRTPKDEEEE